jgi:hypothetical protein
VQHVKLVHRKVKLSAVELIHPIVCHHEGKKPHEQNSIVDDCAPQKRTAQCIDVHDAPPDLRERTDIVCHVSVNTVGRIVRIASFSSLTGS